MTKTEKIIAHFTKLPGADVKAVAKKHKAALPMVYKLRKRAHATTEANMALEEMLEMPDPVNVARNANFEKPNAGRKITLNPAQIAIAKKFNIPLETFVKAGLANGTLQYDDEKIPVGDSCDECDEEPPTIDAVLAQRGNRYGSFEDNAKTTQMLQNVLHSQEGWYNLSFVQRESIEMIMHKISRLVNGDPLYLDTVVDIDGYNKLMLNHMKERREKQEVEE